MGTAKVKSGSKEGKVQYPYNAMVYIDGTNVYAINNDGNIINRGTDGVDNQTVILDAESTITSGKLCIYGNVFDIVSSTSLPEFGKFFVSEILETLGSARLLSPYIEITGTSITDQTRNSNTLTAQSSVATWRGYEGRSTYYDFDGAANYLYRTNDTDFDFGNAAIDQAFTLVVCLNPDDVTSRQIIGKWDVNNAREWRLFFDGNGYPTLQLYDESADTWIGRQDQTAFSTGSWKVLIATYDGSTIAAGCKIYIDGAQLDDADYTNGAYTAMEAVTANLTIGALKNAAVYSEYFDGKMTWIGVTAKELSADEVWSVTQRLKGVLGI